MKKFQSVRNFVNMFLKEAQRRIVTPQWQPERYTDPDEISGEERPQDYRINPRSDYSIPDFELETAPVPEVPPVEKKEEKFRQLSQEEFEQLSEEEQQLYIQNLMEAEQKRQEERERRREEIESMSPVKRDPRKQRREELWGKPKPGFEFEPSKLEPEEKEFPAVAPSARTEPKGPEGGNRFSEFMDYADQELKEIEQSRQQANREADTARERENIEQIVNRAKEEVARMQEVQPRIAQIVMAKRKSRPQRDIDIRGRGVWTKVNLPKTSLSEAEDMWILTNPKYKEEASKLISEFRKLKDSLEMKKSYLSSGEKVPIKRSPEEMTEERRRELGRRLFPEEE